MIRKARFAADDSPFAQGAFETGLEMVRCYKAEGFMQMAGLISKLGFMTLDRTAADSLASEQAAGLMTIADATPDIERRMSGLSELEQCERHAESHAR